MDCICIIYLYLLNFSLLLDKMGRGDPCMYVTYESKCSLFIREKEAGKMRERRFTRGFTLLSSTYKYGHHDYTMAISMIWLQDDCMMNPLDDRMGPFR